MLEYIRILDYYIMEIRPLFFCVNLCAHICLKYIVEFNLSPSSLLSISVWRLSHIKVIVIFLFGDTLSGATNNPLVVTLVWEPTS